MTEATEPTPEPMLLRRKSTGDAANPKKSSKKRSRSVANAASVVSAATAPSVPTTDSLMADAIAEATDSSLPFPVRQAPQIESSTLSKRNPDGKLRRRGGGGPPPTAATTALAAEEPTAPQQLADRADHYASELYGGHILSKKKIKKTFSSKEGKKQDIKLSRQLKKEGKLAEKAAELLAKREILLPDEGGSLEAGDEFGEATFKYRQKQIRENVDCGTAAKGYEFNLDYGNYDFLSYTPTGRHLLFGGSKGHVALLDTQKMEVVKELKLKETVRCVQALGSVDLFAVSQKKCCYIYDQNGVEIHQLKQHSLVNAMDFLRYHYLLVTGSEFGDIRWHDVTTGELVCGHKTKKGPIRAMRQNRANGVMHVGGTNGVVGLCY